MAVTRPKPAALVDQAAVAAIFLPVEVLVYQDKEIQEEEDILLQAGLGAQAAEAALDKQDLTQITLTQNKAGVVMDLLQES